MLAGLDPMLHLVAIGGGLLVALLLLRWLGRGARAGGHAPPTVVGLTPAHALHVVEVEGRRLLVGTGPGGPPRLLMELPASPTPAWSAPSRDAPPWAHDAGEREGWRTRGP